MITPTDQNVERSIMAITNVLNDITISEGPRTQDSTGKFSTGNTDVDSVVVELSTIFVSLFDAKPAMIGKLILDLSDKHKRFSLVRFMFDDARLKIEGVKTFFRRLSDGQYDVLVRILLNCSLPRFWRLLKICADIEVGQCRHLPSRPGNAQALIVRVHNLPNELFDAVGELSVPKLFLSSMLQLKGLPLDLLEPIQKGMIWVVDDGPPSVSTDMLFQLPMLQLWNILSVSLRFTIYDLSVQRKNPSDGFIRDVDQGLEEAMAQLSTHDDVVAQLKDIWHAKWEQVALLRLDSLTLDVTECFSPDREFLGFEVARTLPRFIHGLPKNFAVLAPTEASRIDILEILT